MLDWQPSATLKTLRDRAAFIASIRDFFASRNILEIETPLLSQYTVTDPHIDSFSVPGTTKNYFLQTSPEYAMKRLLAAGSGPIYQICKAFRANEVGQYHNPEFTLLEWYQPGYDHHELMTELDTLCQQILATQPAQRLSYQNCWLDIIKVDPLSATLDELHTVISLNITINALPEDFDTCCQLIMSHLIEPKLGHDVPIFIYDFPASQAALALLNKNDNRVAERFELFISGIELANGFNELVNATEQRTRFLENQHERCAHQRFVPEIDERLLAALEAGISNCAGVAVGLDRLFMISTRLNTISAAMAFDWQRC